MTDTFQRKIVDQLVSRLSEPRKFIQIVSGPRQTGKTTAIKQALTKQDIPHRIASADRISSQTAEWLEAEWMQARSLIGPKNEPALLVVDEIQSIPQWSNMVKALWDEDSWNDTNLKVILSGSSSLLLQKGLSESLMGRYEMLYSTHWNYSEMSEAFGYSIEDFLYYGGYPGTAQIKGDHSRWQAYMDDAIIEATLSKDVLLMEDVRRPVLLRNLFFLGAQYSRQELSYRKILGQLNDKGNTATIAHYLTLLSNAGLLCGLQKFDGKELNTRKSSPRFAVYDTSLMTAVSSSSQKFSEESERGHLVESAVGAYLLAQSKTQGFDLFWWREENKEVDFVVRKDNQVKAIEVKSGRIKKTQGLEEFLKLFPGSKPLIVGDRNCSLEDFLGGKISLFE